MINILDKHKCCGCSSCAQICPKGCIAMTADAEGFLYPKVDSARCVDCGACEAACPELQSLSESLPERVWAVKSTDEEVRRQSSSGGVFTALAEEILREGGVVFGAAFAEDWSVGHICVENAEELGRLRGSKYLQSVVGETFKQCRTFLRAGRKVLFSGTPCQIAGLNQFLRKKYPNLVTLDFVCHGVPSSKVWQSYLKQIVGRKHRVVAASFRSKPNGWKNYCMQLTLQPVAPTACSSEARNRVITQPFVDNPYMKAFLSDLDLRPSCYACPAKSGRSGADITLGDFWGIEHIDPEFDDDRGCSLVMLHTEPGRALFTPPQFGL